MNKDEFLEKHNPNDNYPFWDNTLSKDLDSFIKEHDEQIRADERAKVVDEFLKTLCIGCSYLDGINCTNKNGCPCVISQREVVRTVGRMVQR